MTNHVHYDVKCNGCKKRFNCIHEGERDCSVEFIKSRVCICPKCWAKRHKQHNMGCCFLKDAKNVKEKVVFT